MMTVAVFLFFVLLIAAWVATSVAVSIAEWRLAGLKSRTDSETDND